MKIGIDARFFGPESKGLGRYTQKLIEHLERIDHVNQYVIFLRAENFDHYTPQNPHFSKVCADYQWYTLAEQLFLPRILRRAQCDFIHFPHFNVPLLYRRPFLVTIHDLILVRFPTQKASTHGRMLYWFKFLAYKIVIKSAVTRARHIFAVSKFTANDIAQYYPGSADKTSVTYEAGPEHIPQSAAIAVVPSDKPYFLYVGNAYPHKNLSFLTDAFELWKRKSHANHRLILVGRRDYFYGRLAQEIASKDIRDVEIKDTVDDAELVELYRGATAFLFPSLYEGFGLPPLEANAYGVPVVSADHPCMREILGEGALYADAHDVTTFSACLERIVHDDVLRKDLIACGRAQAKKYTWQSTALQTFSVYDKQCS